MNQIEKRIEFARLAPGSIFIETSDKTALFKYLSDQNFLLPNETIENINIPGAGNMNYVIRIVTDQRSFILKQSRPWVEKYPMIEAPIERILVEAEFYKSLLSNEYFQSCSPKIHIVDDKNFIIIMEDLGNVKDFSFLYHEGASITKAQIQFLAKYLIQLHQVNTSDFPNNDKMRKLNHEHIFNIPFDADNGLDLNSIQFGLDGLAKEIISNKQLINRIHYLGELYTSKGDTLIHGDFYPGSWMQNENFFILDPEFCFLGPPEFDLAVACAHFKITKQPDDLIDLFLSTYTERIHVDKSKIYSFAGVEILRRLLGIAQLPLTSTLEEKRVLIDLSKKWILS